MDVYMHNDNGAFLYYGCWGRLRWDMILERVWGECHDMISVDPTGDSEKRHVSSAWIRIKRGRKRDTFHMDIIHIISK